MNKERITLLFLALLGLALIVTLIYKAPIEQDIAYHLFCNESCMGGISNFWNVVSNLPFLFAGGYGLYSLKKQKNKNWNYIIFFVGVSLVSLGSGYYHLNPNNETLVWDRLPMTIAFTAFLSIVISEFLSKKWGKKLLVPLIFAGAFSIVYWVFKADLSFYAFVQFYPMICVPVILLVFKNETSSKKGYWLLLLFYVLAKVLETYDHEIHHLTGFVSGHPLKHVSAALGVFMFAYFSTKKAL